MEKIKAGAVAVHNELAMNYSSWIFSPVILCLCFHTAISYFLTGSKCSHFTNDLLQTSKVTRSINGHARIYRVTNQDVCVKQGLAMRGSMLRGATQDNVDNVGRSTSENIMLKDLPSMGVKDALSAIRKKDNNSKSPLPIFEGVDIVKAKPSVGTFVIANPKAFLDPENSLIANSYGVDTKSLDNNAMPIADLATILPVIYIADIHSEYGTLGFLLNKVSGTMMGDLHPALKSFRNRPVYLGGTQNRGSSFTMLHQKVGYPENRAFKSVPGRKDSKLFFSPDLAMGNELCLTNDAKPTDFKFFQWATVWAPSQLDMEYRRKLWLTIEGPTSIIFEDESSTNPLYRRIFLSIPDSRLG